MKILITGRNGQLGWELARRLASGPHDVVALGRAELDLSDTASIAPCIERHQPALVVNAAAYTAVDRAQTEPDLAMRVNADAPGEIAAACARMGAALVHFSTDYVFDGTKPGRWTEDDPCGPLNVYGASKLEGERAVAATGAAAVVLRTSWVFGEHGGNFARTMLRLATERDTLRVVADQRGVPTWTARLAEAVALMADTAPEADAPGVAAWFARRAGVYHAAPAGATTWHGYARHVIATAMEEPAFAARLRVRPEAIEAIPTAAFPTPAARPANSLLDCGKLERVFGIAWPQWQEDVAACVRRMVSDSAQDPVR